MKMCFRFILFIFLMASCVVKGSYAGPKDVDLEAAVQQAVSDWAPILNCHVLEQEGFNMVLGIWNDDRDKIIPLMRASNTDLAVIERILKLTEPDNVMTKTKGSAADLISYCKENQDWSIKWTTFENLPLFSRVKRVLNPK